MDIVNATIDKHQPEGYIFRIEILIDLVSVRSCGMYLM